MAENGNGKSLVSFKWIAGILVSILLILGGYTFGTSLGDVKASVKALQENKLDKEQYRSDISDLKQKVDCIYNWHLPPELRK